MTSKTPAPGIEAAQLEESRRAALMEAAAETMQRNKGNAQALATFNQACSDYSAAARRLQFAIDSADKTIRN